MGRKSRSKGARGELSISRKLSAWWTGDLDLLEENAANLPIRRTPGSGGWAKGKGVGGDLVSVKEETNDFLMWSVEVKNREDWSFDQIIKLGRSWVVNEWWAQCRGDAKVAKAWPLLIFTKNHQPWYYCISSRTYKRLCLTHGYDKKKPPYFVMRFMGRVYGQLDHFIETFNREKCRKAFDVSK